MNLTELTSNVGTNILIIGLPGAGKTASLRNLDPATTLIVTSEPLGLETLRKWGWDEARVLAPETRDDWQTVVPAIEAEEGVKTVVVDTLSSCHDMFMETFIDIKRRAGTSVEQLGQDLYRVANLQFQEVLRGILKLHLAGVDLVMLCHMKYRVAGDKQWKVPSLSENLTNWICRLCSIVLRCENYSQGTTELWRFHKGGSSGDFGTDKIGVCENSEPNDIAAILKRVHDKKEKDKALRAHTGQKGGGGAKTQGAPEKAENGPEAPENGPKKPDQPEFEMKRPPERTKAGKYQELMRVAGELPVKLSKQEVIEFAVKTAKKEGVGQISVKQYDTIIKKLKEKYTAPF
jgi:hypothetical protein